MPRTTSARSGAPEETTGAGREATAERLLRSTAAHGYDPELDIDWSAPFEQDKDFILPHRCSLYATALWERIVSLPIFPGMRDDERDHVVRTVKAVCARHAR